MPAPSLSPQLFLLLASLVEERSGLHYGPDEALIFAEKIGGRIGEAGFESALDYYYFLRYDPAGTEELGALVDALVVGETYLFREADALQAAITSVIRPAIAERGRARVWSAGCSTGDEPFTLAMLCAEEGILAKLDLLATDISQRSLTRARAGKLGIRSLRVFSPNTPHSVSSDLRHIVDRHVVNGLVTREIVDAIDFERESLVGAPPKREGFDLILCRNVLIYFRDEVIREVVRMLSERLRPGGRLLVGASESLLRFGTILRCEERGGAFFYVKPERP